MLFAVVLIVLWTLCIAACVALEVRAHRYYTSHAVDESHDDEHT
jgi:hypothetical protein